MEIQRPEANSGLLPGELSAVTLSEGDDVAHPWCAVFEYLDGDHRPFGFDGGVDPRAWLAHALWRQHGFEEAKAITSARTLFGPFVPPEPDTGSDAHPYGMPA